ncbi:hypothetical protein Chor_015992, partial [Crotalus horridus]
HFVIHCVKMEGPVSVTISVPVHMDSLAQDVKHWFVISTVTMVGNVWHRMNVSARLVGVVLCVKQVPNLF